MTSIIDFHHHLVNERGYVDELLKEMDRLGVDKVCLSALGPLFDGLFVKGTPDEGSADNGALEKVIKNHPDRLVGFGFLRPGKDSPDAIDYFVEAGFRGVKITIPLSRYDDKAYFPLYERAQRLDLPILFHTGIVTPPKPQPEEDISSVRMLPILLEPVAQAFPNLTIVIAHMGVTYKQDSAAMARIFPNVYVDLSGRLDGWRKGVSPGELKSLFYWEGAEKKILYGSDVHWDEMEQTLNDQKRIFKKMKFDKMQRQRIFSDNARRILHIS